MLRCSNILKRFLDFLNILGVLAGVIFIWHLGYFIIKFPDNESTLPYFTQITASLAIIVLIQQILLITVASYDYLHRVWLDKMKQELCKELFTFTIFNYGLALVALGYYLVIISKRFQPGWIKRSNTKNAIYKIVINTASLDFMSKISSLYIQIFLVLFAIGWIALTIKSIPLALIVMKIIALYLMIIFPFAVLFQQLMIIHIISHKWIDSSFDKYFTKKMIFLPGIAFAEYYKDVVRNEII